VAAGAQSPTVNCLSEESDIASYFVDISLMYVSLIQLNSLSAPPGLLAAIWWCLLLRGRQGRGKGKEGDGKGKDDLHPTLFLGPAAGKCPK